MERLFALARLAGVKTLIGSVWSENQGMLQLSRDLGFTVRPTEDTGVMEAILQLAAQP